MERREFLKYGTASLAAGLTMDPVSALAQAACQTCVVGRAVSPVTSVELSIGDVRTRMVDGTFVNQIGFNLVRGFGPMGAFASMPPRVPGPVIRVKEGTPVQIKIRNDRKEWHGFEITNIPESKTQIAPGCTCTVNFTAPQAGTYIYHDAWGDTPLYRILGLHGVMVVEPAAGMTAARSRTPYSLDKIGDGPRRAISAVFDALGMTERFQGGTAGKWVPAALNVEHSIQEKIWVCSAVDPKFNALVVPGQQITSNPTLTSNVVGNFVPEYFTLNNRSGFDLHDDLEGQFPVIPKNYIGEPTLLRTVNVGLCHHANHIHGNHLFDLARVDFDPTSPTYGRQTAQANVFEVDTWALWPMQRRDMLLPYEIPPDIPYRIPLSNPTGGQFQRMVNRQAQEPFPLRYVMHCHVEMSQTAAGGNYPQGLVSHWEIHGGLGGRAKAAQSLASR